MISSLRSGSAAALRLWAELALSIFAVTVGNAPLLAQALDSARSPPLIGINLSGAELNPGSNKLNYTYVFPTTNEMDYFIGKGMRCFRIPVLSDRLFQPTKAGVLHPTADWESLTKLVNHAAASNVRVIVDLHQYGTMLSGVVGRDEPATNEFAAFWSEVARRLRNEPNIVFGLMNEPHEQTAEEWLVGLNAAISAIRAAGATQLILAPGSYWSGAHNWTRTGNAVAMRGVVDTHHNFAYEAHQYLDADHSGRTSNVVAGSGREVLRDFTDWVRSQQLKAYLGEFGFSGSPDAMREGKALLDFMSDNRDVWLGGSYWAAGPWWGDYMFSVEPDEKGDKPQMSVLSGAVNAMKGDHD